MFVNVLFVVNLQDVTFHVFYHACNTTVIEHINAKMLIFIQAYSNNLYTFFFYLPNSAQTELAEKYGKKPWYGIGVCLRSVS